MDDKEREEMVGAFRAGQDAAFREQALLWARDESITNEEFGRLVCDLSFKSAMNRLYFEGNMEKILGVDESQPRDVE